MPRTSDLDLDLVRARYRGSLLGLAAGDAVGTTVEFEPPGTFEPVVDMIGGGRSGSSRASGPMTRRWRCA